MSESNVKRNLSDIITDSIVLVIVTSAKFVLKAAIALVYRLFMFAFVVFGTLLLIAVVAGGAALVLTTVGKIAAVVFFIAAFMLIMVLPIKEIYAKVKEGVCGVFNTQAAAA